MNSNPVFNVTFGVDEITFGVNMATANQSIAVGFEQLQVITQGLDDFEIYQGSYAITPAVEAQTLETKDRKMEEDLTILEIPYFETSNQSGTTVIIGG